MYNSLRAIYASLQRNQRVSNDRQSDGATLGATNTHTSRPMHIYEKPVLRKRRQASIDGKENVIGKPKLFATTFDEDSLDSMPTVGEAQALHAGPRKPAALEKWKRLEGGAEPAKLTT